MAVIMWSGSLVSVVSTPLSLLHMFRAVVFLVFFFFFSSRRRHTRSYGDWSSDVCSSDLDVEVVAIEVDPLLDDQFVGLLEPPFARLGIAQVQQPIAARFAELPFRMLLVRSEERRVGKEWRSGVWR